MLNLFIDIDGVLLGKNETTNKVVIANYATAFLEYSLKYFDCYWLTTHCKGSIETVIDYLTPYADEKFIELIKCVKPTNFRTFKLRLYLATFSGLMINQQRMRFNTWMKMVFLNAGYKLIREKISTNLAV